MVWGKDACDLGAEAGGARGYEDDFWGGCGHFGRRFGRGSVVGAVRRGGGGLEALLVDVVECGFTPIQFEAEGLVFQ